ncbi:type II toxin-antitoxin system HicA family toxin [Candidatus Woesearchaeota archaeon]|nr:type II toxin-antitoxin system HicA family toxin [Candidatus Woesearchaeota archaeon]
MRLPVVTAKDFCAFLEKEGFVMVRQKGSHKFYKNEDGRMTTVPVHPGKDLGRGLVKEILNQIGMSREEFFRKWK